MAETRSVRFGSHTITYELSRADRKTLAISVLPDLTVAATAPQDAPLDEIDRRIVKRGKWIRRKQLQYERYLPHLPPRQYVSGETHSYLGRHYRLKVEDGALEGIRIDHDRIHVTAEAKDPARVQTLLESWYRARAQEIFAERLEACFPRMRHTGVPYPQLSVRTMRTRWGSLSPAGRLILNLKLVQVPKRCIDYVIYHELCHLKVPHHGPEYYALLERILPDWEERREKLNSFRFA